MIEKLEGLSSLGGALRDHESRKKAACILFFVGYGVYLVWKISTSTALSLPEGSFGNTAIHGLCLVLLLASIVLDFKPDANMALSALLLAIGVAIKLCSDNVVFIDLAFLFCAGMRIDFVDIARFSAIVVSAVCSAVVLLSLAGVIVNYPFSRGGGTVRWGLGFLWCTLPSHFLLLVVLLAVYLRKARLAAWHYAVFLVLDVAIYLATDSRNSFALVLFVLAACLLLRALRGRGLSAMRSALGFLARVAFAGIFAVSLFAACLYDAGDPTWAAVNSVTSNRLSHTNGALGDYGVTLFGQDIEFVGNGLMAGSDDVIKYEVVEGDRRYVDSSFLQILICDGAVALVVVFAVYQMAARRASKEGDVVMCLVMLVIMAHSAFDPQLINVQYNAFLFWWWQSFVMAASEWLDGLPWPPGRNQRGARPISVDAGEGVGR